MLRLALLLLLLLLLLVRVVVAGLGLGGSCVVSPIAEELVWGRVLRDSGKKGKPLRVEEGGYCFGLKKAALQNGEVVTRLQ